MNHKLKRLIIAIFVFYFILQIFSFGIQKKEHHPFHERAVVALTAPVQWMIHSTWIGIKSMISNYVFLVNTKEQNRVLVDRISALEQKLVTFKEMEIENLRLQRIFDLQVEETFVRVVAKKIAYGSSRFEKTIRIQKGSRHGLREGLPVINADGIVGQVIDVYRNYSDVLLITDPTSSMDVIVQRSRANGMLKGGLKNQLAFQYLSKESDVFEEDVVITSGLDGIYPKAIAVGKVSAVGVRDKGLFLDATVRPFVNFENLEEVVVLLPTQPTQ
ncbi:MAG: rod shape-determining protein MreC [Bdellovibrionales bacterium]|nr:rod shape-determining protein MreC [Bdellovibrionales bacterium]